MAFELPQRRQNVRQIQTQQRRIPIEQIIAIEGQSPIATGIETAGNVLGQALTRRAELQRQGQQLAKLEQLAGQEPGAFQGIDPSMAASFAMNAVKQKAELEQIAQRQNADGKPRPLQGTIQKDGKTLQPFYNEKTGEISYQELVGPKQAPPKGLQFAGMSPENIPISYDPNTGLTSLPGKQNYTGPSLPKTIGTEEQRRQALVGGAKTSIDDVRNIITSDPSTLNELKAIKMTPGRVYSQLASPNAKRLYINLREAIANEIYLKTGATANEQELENATVSYMAALNDSPADFIGRMDLLERNITPFNQRKLNEIQPAKPKPLPQTGFSPNEEEEYQKWKLSQLGGKR